MNKMWKVFLIICFLCVSGCMKKDEKIVKSDQKEREITLHIQVIHEAVSYTHLDVYKRQVPEPVICMFQGYMTVLRSYVMITVLRIYRLKMHVGDAYQIWMAMIKIRNMHLILKAMEKKWQIM